MTTLSAFDAAYEPSPSGPRWPPSQASLGLSSAVALEGVAHRIRSNAVAPTAITRIAAGVRPGDLTDEDLALAARGDPDLLLPFDPELVTPMVVYLARWCTWRVKCAT